jgi:hypothetical protein
LIFLLRTASLSIIALKPVKVDLMTCDSSFEDQDPFHVRMLVRQWMT